MHHDTSLPSVEHLKASQVDEIVVQDKTATIRGSYAALAETMQKIKMGNLHQVPTFNLDWCARRDSNSLVRRQESVCNLLINLVCVSAFRYSYALQSTTLHDRVGQKSGTEFVLSHALASAERVVQEHESITLKPKDFEAFLVAQDAPPKPNLALGRAFKRHADQVHR